jgi:Clp amino terminal domain, pathogenicity island component
MIVDFEQTMRLAAQESERREHGYLGTEDALLGLLRTSNARTVSVLRSRGLTAEAVEAELGRLEEEGVVPRCDGGRDVLRGLGIDIEEVVARLDRSFGRAAVDEATCRVARRRCWRRGRRGLAPLAKAVLVKRAVELAERHADEAGREQATIDDVVVGILRDAKDPLGDAAQPPGQALAPATRSCSGDPGARASDRRSVRAQARATRPRADSARPIRRQLTRPTLAANPTHRFSRAAGNRGGRSRQPLIRRCPRPKGLAYRTRPARPPWDSSLGAGKRKRHESGSLRPKGKSLCPSVSSSTMRLLGSGRGAEGHNDRASTAAIPASQAVCGAQPRARTSFMTMVLG